MTMSSRQKVWAVQVRVLIGKFLSDAAETWLRKYVMRRSPVVVAHAPPIQHSDNSTR